MLVCVAVGLAWLIVDHLPRKPPNIFDTAVDDVFGYMADEDFNRLAVEQRMQFLMDVLKRFSEMDQGESALASSFLAGLSGPANEKLIANARILGKDILVHGASEFLTLKDQQQRAAFLDQWLVKWFRLGGLLGGEQTTLSDQQILDRLTRQGQNDIKRGIEIDARVAQQVADFWDRDVASVATPAEQAQIYQFLPAIRSHILTRGR